MLESLEEAATYGRDSSQESLSWDVSIGELPAVSQAKQNQAILRVNSVIGTCHVQKKGHMARH